MKLSDLTTHPLATPPPVVARVPDPLQITPLTGAAGMPAADAGTTLFRLLGLLGRQKWKALAFIAFVMLATGIVSFQQEPLYEATTVVRVSPRSPGGAVDGGASTANDIDKIMATEIQVFESDPVLRPVAEKFDLLEREKQFKGLSPEEIRRKQAAPVSLKRFAVERPPNTYLIRLTYSANDPRFAAAVANEIAASYFKQTVESRDREYADVSAAIKHRLGDLRAKMEISAGNLVSFEKELNMIDPAQGTNLLTGRLSQLNTEFTAAQAERLRKQAVQRAVAESGTIAAAEASGQAGPLDHAIDVLNEARQRFAAIKSIYGENYSEYKKAKEQLDELEKQVDQLRASTSDRVNLDYTQALGREELLRGVVDETKREVYGLGAKEMQYEQMKRDAENNRKVYEDLERRAAETDIGNQLREAVVEVSSLALPADKKAFPRPLLNLALAFVLSSVLTVVFIVVSDALDTTLSDPDEAAMRLNVSVLGVIPAMRKLLSPAESAAGNHLAPRSTKAMERFSEAIRGLRTSIVLASLDQPVRSVLITSAELGEGKSTTAANLAVSFAQTGKRVLLVDADLHAPTVHRHFQIDSSTGLSDILIRGLSWRETMVKIGPNDLYVIPGGPVSPSVADLFAPRASEFFGQVSSEFDIVIVDAPPVPASEARQLARLADTVLVVARAEKTSGKAVASALAGLFHAQANVIGLVMAQAKSSSFSYGYGYSDGADQRRVARTGKRGPVEMNG